MMNQNPHPQQNSQNPLKTAATTAASDFKRTHLLHHYRRHLSSLSLTEATTSNSLSEDEEEGEEAAQAQAVGTIPATRRTWKLHALIDRALSITSLQEDDDDDDDLADGDDMGSGCIDDDDAASYDDSTVDSLVLTRQRWAKMRRPCHQSLPPPQQEQDQEPQVPSDSVLLLQRQVPRRANHRDAPPELVRIDTDELLSNHEDEDDLDEDDASYCSYESDVWREALDEDEHDDDDDFDPFDDEIDSIAVNQRRLAKNKSKEENGTMPYCMESPLHTASGGVHCAAR
jgi:hypothetical protein